MHLELSLFSCKSLKSCVYYWLAHYGVKRYVAVNLADTAESSIQKDIGPFYISKFRMSRSLLWV